MLIYRGSPNSQFLSLRRYSLLSVVLIQKVSHFHRVNQTRRLRKLSRRSRADRQLEGVKPKRKSDLKKKQLSKLIGKDDGGVAAAAAKIHQNLQNPEEDDGTGNGNGGLFVKVMTDEQMGQLRQQIAVYTTICDQLVDLHKQLSAQQDLTGMRLGNFYCDPFMASGGHQITSRQRWTPSPVQLKILEQIFEEGNGTPCKQKIKELTMELTQHGQISETNVYHWFQNRRARSKRKQSMIAQNNAESDAEPEVESPRDEKTKPEDILSFDNSALRAENIYLQSPELGFGNFDW